MHKQTLKEMTAGQILEWTIDCFNRAGIDSARADAEILLSAVIGCKRFDVNLRLGEILNEIRLAQMRSFIEQRRRRVPVAYILGDWEFMGLQFFVSEHTLVPRPETEHLVEAALAQIARGGINTAVDLCTGSGNIAVSVAKLSGVKVVYASDISKEALAVADKNVVRNTAAGKVLLRCGDMFCAFAGDALEGKIDLLLSNPPYIPEHDYSGLEPEIKYEPKEALVCPEGGMQAYKKIALQAGRYLSDGAILLIELNSMLANDIAQIFSQAGYCIEAVIKDYAGRDRVLKARFGRA